MKPISLLALVVAWPLAISVAFVSLSSASVCSKSGTGTACAAGHGKLYESSISAKLASGTKFKLISGFTTFACTEANLGAEITNAEAGEGSISSLTFGGCTLEASTTTCTFSSSASSKNKWFFTTTVGVAPSGTAKMANPTIIFTCNGKTCRYTASQAGGLGEIRITGGETASLTWAKVPVDLEAPSESVCLSTAILEAEFTLTAPDSLYLTGLGPSATVCSHSGTGPTCGLGHGSEYSGALNAKLGAKSTFVLTSGFVSITCGESSIGGEVSSGEKGEGKLSSFTAVSCSNNINKTACTVETTASAGTSWQFIATPGSAPNGMIEVEGFTTSFTCNILGKNRTCRYKVTKLEVAVTGGETASLALSGAGVEKEEVSDGLCSKTASLDAAFSVTTPDSLYLT